MPAALALLLAAAQAQAPAAPPPPAEATQGALIFGPDFFADFRPADALDMVKRLPGFTLDEGDEEVRGYAAATGNVLIDGKPPSSKEEGLEEALRRIPAASVERIELIRGGAIGVDMGGHAVVANVIRKRVATQRASAEGGLTVADDGVVRPNLRLEASRQAGVHRLEGALALETEVDEDSGDGRIRSLDDSGAVFDEERRRQWEILRTLSATGEYETPLVGGLLTANASVSRERKQEDVDSFALVGDEGETARERERVLSGEGSARYRAPLARAGYVEALLLHRLSTLRARSSESDGEGEERFAEDTDSSETIARFSVRRERPRLAIDAAVEGALNRLDSRASLEEDGQAVPLPGSDAHVEERRAEASVGATWRPGGRLTVEPALAAEVSIIESTGDAASRESFTYLKPRLAATLELGRADQVRFEVKREVGQLDFEDFVASATLDRDEVTAGAVSLRPPQSWTASASFEHRFWGDGAIVLRYRREWIDDVVDRVAVIRGDDVFDAVGNIGAGTRHTGELELSAPLSRLGLSGVLLRAALTVRHSRVTDPITGERRIISEDKPVEGEIKLSQDLMGGALSWGIDLEVAEHERQFRFDELRLETEELLLSAHVEYRPARDWRIRLEALNLTRRTIGDRRVKFAGLRSVAPVEEIERLSVRATPVLLLTVRKDFGGR